VIYSYHKYNVNTINTLETLTSNHPPVNSLSLCELLIILIKEIVALLLLPPPVLLYLNLLPRDIPISMHLRNRQAWQLLRLCLSIVQLLVAGQM